MLTTCDYFRGLSKESQNLVTDFLLQNIFNQDGPVDGIDNEHYVHIVEFLVDAYRELLHESMTALKKLISSAHQTADQANPVKFSKPENVKRVYFSIYQTLLLYSTISSKQELADSLAKWHELLIPMLLGNAGMRIS